MKNLRQILEQQKISQSELARRLGVTRQQVFYWCREVEPYRPSKKYRGKIEQILKYWEE